MKCKIMEMYKSNKSEHTQYIFLIEEGYLDYKINNQLAMNLYK